jgi:putative spermidine/putrescine transport system ATP-binding protein
VVMRDGRVRQLGTPEELYARPTHPDVAEFMGYRNLVPSTAEAAGNLLSVIVGGARIMGVPVDAVPGKVTVAIRPEDLTPSADAPISAQVEAAEYRGRDFYGLARAADQTALYFRSEARVVPGETVRLGAPPERVLVYAEAFEA